MNKIITLDPDAVDFTDPIPSNIGGGARDLDDRTVRIIQRCKANPGKWLPIAVGRYAVNLSRHLKAAGLKAASRTEDTGHNGKQVTTYVYLPN